MKDLTEALRINPEFAEPYGNRGAVFYKMGDYHSALQDYKAYIDMNGENKKDVEDFLPTVEAKLK